jgi:PKHD-type hydroxylase
MKIDQTRDLVLFSCAEKVFSDQELWVINNTANKSDKNISQAKVAIENSKSYDIEEEYRKTDIVWLLQDDNTKWLYERLYNAATALNQQYFNFEIDQLENLQYCIYKEGHHFKKHIDTISIPNLGQRKLTFILQLSDETEYEGGELRLHVSDNPIVISKKKGTIAIFPSFIPHDVTPVTKGERKVLVSWVLGKNDLR